MDFLQADNELRTFAKETGGTAYFPKFEGEYGQMFQMLHQALRNQYVLDVPAEQHQARWHIPQAESGTGQSGDNEPLPVKDEKGKPIKYQIIAKAGYKAPRAVE